MTRNALVLFPPSFCSRMWRLCGTVMQRSAAVDGDEDDDDGDGAIVTIMMMERHKHP